MSMRRFLLLTTIGLSIASCGTAPQTTETVGARPVMEERDAARPVEKPGGAPAPAIPPEAVEAAPYTALEAKPEGEGATPGFEPYLPSELIEEQYVEPPEYETRRPRWLEIAREDLESGHRAEAEAAYRMAVSTLEPEEPEFTEAVIELVGMLEEEGRFEEIEPLLTLAGIEPDKLLKLKIAESHEARGNPLAAVDAYMRMSPELDDIELSEINARLRSIVDTLGEPELMTLSVRYFFNELGGYAALRLARMRFDEGRDAEALGVLARLEYLYPGHPMGLAAARMRTIIHARRNVRPGHIGILLPLTSRLAPLGEKVLDGIMLGSGLLAPGKDADPQVEIVQQDAEGQNTSPVFHIGDTAGDPGTARRAVAELAAEGVTAIIGPLKGDVAKAAAEEARKYGIPILTLTPARDITGEGVFRLNMREEDEMDRLARHAIEELGIRRFAILAPDTEQGRLYRELFWDAVVRHGGEIAGSQLFAEVENPSLKTPIHKLTGIYGLSKSDLKELFALERIAEIEKERSMLLEYGVSLTGAEAALGNPEKEFARYEPAPLVDFQAVFMPVSSLEAAQLAPQLPYYDVSGETLLGIRSWNYSALTRVGKEYVEGARFPVEWSEESAEAKTFVAAFEQAYGRKPGTLEAYGFDAAAIVMRALGDNQASGRNELSLYLSRLWAVPAVTGPITAHPNGELAVEPKLMAVRHMRIVPAVTKRSESPAKEQ